MLLPTKVSRADTLQQIFAFRYQVWKLEDVNFGQDALESWTDIYDATAHHWAVIDDRGILAAARLTVHDTLSDMLALPNLPKTRHFDTLQIDLKMPVAVLGRLVVAPCARGMKLSTSLDKIRLEEAAILKCKSVVVATSNPQRVPALMKHGFQVAAEVDLLVGQTLRPGKILVLALSDGIGKSVIR